MIDFLKDIVFAVGLGGLISWGYLLHQALQLILFHREIKGLPDETFSGTSEFARYGNAFLSEFRRADESKVLSQFDVEKHMSPLAMRLRTVGGSTRGIAGLMILIALVATLMNLQGAVSGLGQTFQELSSKEKQDVAQADRGDVVDRVQQALGRVATTASTAFFLSGMMILIAFLLLLTALGVQREAHRCLREFAARAYGAYAARIAETGKGSEAEQKVDFSEAIAHFKALVKSFGSLSEELGTLGLFRTELSAATTAITAAVDRLPAAIQSNISTLSSQMTREIAEDLKRQYDVLSNLLVIYADLKLKVKSMELYTEKVAEQHKQASAAVTALGSLPEETRKLTVASSALTNTIGSLQGKVEAIPAMDIAATKTALDGLQRELGSVADSLRAFRERTQTKQDGLERTLSELERRMRDANATEASSRRESVEAARSEFADVKRRLDALGAAVKAGDHASELAHIQEQLKAFQSRTFFDFFRGGGRGPAA
ncbi:MAG: hypothetical protein ABI693_19620 [Bryobacteraceae bacterium]